MIKSKYTQDEQNVNKQLPAININLNRLLITYSISVYLFPSALLDYSIL